MTTATEWQKLISRIKRADGILKKNKIWDAADLTRPEAEQVVGQMILSLPKGHYKVHDRQYGTNIADKIYEVYGVAPFIHVKEKLLLGLQALYPDKVYASFTHGLDEVEIMKGVDTPSGYKRTGRKSTKGVAKTKGRVPASKVVIGL